MGKTSYKSKSKKKEISIISVIIAVIALILALLGYDFTQLDDDFAVSPSVDTNADCAVHFIDVGQGDSTLIMSDGYNILIDAGENDKGVDVVRYLKEHGVEVLDLVVATHPHSDHMGGLDVVINELDVKKVLVNRLPDSLVPTTKTYTDFLNAVKEKSLRLTASEVGKVFEFGKGTLEILGPVSEADDLNNSSIVAQFTYDDKSFLFTGDMEKESEKELINSDANLKSDVLKVAHHGSKTSTTDAFLEKVDPTIAVISVADGNKYNHPNDTIIDRLEQNGAEIFRTDFDKDIVVTISNGKLAVTTG